MDQVDDGGDQYCRHLAEGQWRHEQEKRPEQPMKESESAVIPEPENRLLAGHQVRAVLVGVGGEPLHTERKMERQEKLGGLVGEGDAIWEVEAEVATRKRKAKRG